MGVSSFIFMLILSAKKKRRKLPECMSQSAKRVPLIERPSRQLLHYTLLTDSCIPPVSPFCMGDEEAY